MCNHIWMYEEVNVLNGKHPGDCKVPENICQICGVDLGEQNQDNYVVKDFVIPELIK